MNFVCDHCNTNFDNKSELELHLLVEHKVSLKKIVQHNFLQSGCMPDFLETNVQNKCTDDQKRASIIQKLKNLISVDQSVHSTVNTKFGYRSLDSSCSADISPISSGRSSSRKSSFDVTSINLQKNQN